MAGGRWVVGVDIGGTKIQAGLVPLAGGEIVGLRRGPTLPEEGADAVVERVAAMVEEVLGELEAGGGSRDDVDGMGIGCPGPLNRATGVVVTTPNLGWRDYPVRDRLSEAVGLPAALDNDANCAVLGEWWQGAGRGSRLLVGLTLGTGIGGGLVLDGRIFHGVSDVAGEIGHMTVDYRGRRCRCGNDGCLEAYASGPNIARRAVEALDAGEESSVDALVDGDRGRITAEVISRAAREGDPFAVRLMGETAEILAAGVASVVNLLNPDAIVIAGGVSRAGGTLFEPLRAGVRRRAFEPAVEACRIVPAELPETAGVAGAGAMFKLQNAGGL